MSSGKTENTCEIEQQRRRVEKVHNQAQGLSDLGTCFIAVHFRVHSRPPP